MGIHRSYLGANILMLLSFLFSSQLKSVCTEQPQRPELLFSKTFYDEIKKDVANDKSFVISPDNIRNSILMLYHGASGQTEKELYKACQNYHVEDPLGQYPLNTLNETHFTYTTANMLFVHDQLEIKKAYLEKTSRYRLHDIRINFGNSRKAVRRINDWVKVQMFNRKVSLLRSKDITKSTRAVLVNLLQMKCLLGLNNIVSRVFWTGRERNRIIPMMQGIAKFKYGKIRRLNAEVIEIALSDEENITMLIMLPDLVENGIKDLEADLLRKNINLANISEELIQTKLFVEIPIIQLASKTYLRKPFERLGIKEAFSSNAEFDELYEDANSTISIQNVIQETKVEIAPVPHRIVPALETYAEFKKFLVNRPFMFVIKGMDSLLALGRYDI